MKKVKELFTKIKNNSFVQKHKFLCMLASVLLAIMIVLKVLGFPMYVYNYINYGHFELLKNLPIFPYSITGSYPDSSTHILPVAKDRVIMFTLNDKYLPFDYKTAFNRIYDIDTKKKQLTIKQTIIPVAIIYPLVVTGDNILLSSKTKPLSENLDDSFYSYNFDEDRLTNVEKLKNTYNIQDKAFGFRDGRALFFAQCNYKKQDRVICPIVSLDTKSKEQKVVHSKVLNHGERIAKKSTLDNGDVLVLFEGKQWFLERYSIRENRFYTIDTSVVSEFKDKVGGNIVHYFVYLGENKFVVISYEQYKTASNIRLALYYINSYGRVVEIQSLEYLNKTYTGSILPMDNAIALNPSQVLFTGGMKGIATLAEPTKRCYLYDSNKNTVTRINDFTYRISRQDISKVTKNGLLMAGGEKRMGILGMKPLNSIYIYKPGRKIEK